MKQLSFLTLLLAGLQAIVAAQSLSIVGKINDSSGAPVEAATVSLLNATDSSLGVIVMIDGKCGAWAQAFKKVSLTGAPL